MFSLNEELIARLLSWTMPSYQATSAGDHNLGFGFLFYGITRVLRPAKIVVIGSKAGFSVICFALGLKDNAGAIIDNVECYDTTLETLDAHRQIYFIDPSYSIERNDPNHWYGVGMWDEPALVTARWRNFGVAHLIQHFKMTSQQFIQQPAVPRDIDLLYIDGDHSHEGILHDFNQYHRILRRDGLILAHDVDPRLKQMDPSTGGYAALCELDPAKFEICRLPVFPGLAIVRKKSYEDIEHPEPK